MYEIDESQIRLWWQTFNPQNKLVEVRLLGKATYSGYFKDVDTLITQIRPYLDHSNYAYYGAMQAYYTINELDEALYSREQRDTFVKKPKSTSTDANVTRRIRVMVDLDPQRVASVSSSSVEYEKAHLKAVGVYRYLMSQGFKEPVVSSSGNGMHLYLTCDMLNDDEHYELVKNFLKSLSNMFSDGEVELDTTVGNAARIDKIIGTWSKKGSDSNERPWRMSKFLKIPEDLTPNDESLFRKIADLLPKEEPKVSLRNNSYRGTEKFNLESWLQSYGVEYRKKQEGGSTKYEIKTCPWHETHSSNNPYSSAIYQDADGKLTYTCAHSHCADKQWVDFRLFYEPNAYNRPAYQPQQQYAPRQYAPQKPKYEIKQEIPELGEKWLSMSSIKKIDISGLEHVKTGFAELDRNIVGLFMSEVTILSGNNGSGKSSWLNTLLLNIVDQGEKVALWSGELRPDILKAWIQMSASGKRNLRESQYGDGKFYVPNSIGERIDRWLDGRFFLYNNEYGAKWEQIFHDMELLLKAGVKVFALDNLFSLDIDILDGDKNGKQKELILQIKEFAKKNLVHIILVAHPRKTTSFLRKNDIAGTSDLQNAVDKIFCVHRVNNDFFRTGAEFFGQGEIQRFQGFGNTIEVMKERLFGVVDLMVGMHYEIESRRFKNTPDEDIQYGWEREPVQQSLDYEQHDVYAEANPNLPFARYTDSDAPF